MEGGGGGDPDDQKGAARVKEVREGHVLFFGIMDEVELHDSDVTGAVHELDKKAVIHTSISPELNFSIRLGVG